MSAENVARFYAALAKDESLRQKVAEIFLQVQHQPVDALLASRLVEAKVLPLAAEHGFVFSLEELLQQITTIIEPQTQKKGIHFRVQRQKNLEKFFLGDVLRLKQVLMNLLSNAVKFTPESGEIVLDIAAVERRNGYAHLRFVLSDTGVGISEDFMHRLFHPFEQENKETSRNNIGSGLGLSIVKKIMEDHGGKVWATSKENIGTVMYFVLRKYQEVPVNE